MAAINHWQITQAANHLLDGKIVAYPTEAVWGLGCDPENEAATIRLLAIKERPVSKGLIVIAGSSEQLEPLLRGLNPGQRRKVMATWPGPTTWLIPDKYDIFPSWIKGQHESVAVRVSAHPLASALCLRFGGPLVSTSANRSGQAPARSALQVVKHLGADVDGLLHGRLGEEKQPSRIIDLVSGRVFR